MPGKRFVVLDEEHGRLKFFDELFDLNARKKVDEVERFIPDVEMRPFTKAPREQHFLLLPVRKRGEFGFEVLDP